MGLDAFVHCACYETGCLKTPPPDGVTLQVESDGSLGRRQPGESLEADLAWDQWLWRSACEHEAGVLLHHRLGNIGLIGLLRAELQREPAQFPILLTQVIYSRSHCGDVLTPDTLAPLQRELDRLATFRCRTKRAGGFMAEFRSQMQELVAAALWVAKPIAF